VCVPPYCPLRRPPPIGPGGVSQGPRPIVIASPPMGLPPTDAPLFAAAARAAREIRVARVALPVPSDELYDYAVPAELDAQAAPGCRVRVPFGGRGARRLVGVIVERAGEARFAGELRAVEQVLDEEPVIVPSL